MSARTNASLLQDAERAKSTFAATDEPLSRGPYVDAGVYRYERKSNEFFSPGPHRYDVYIYETNKIPKIPNDCIFVQVVNEGSWRRNGTYTKY